MECTEAKFLKIFLNHSSHTIDKPDYREGKRVLIKNYYNIYRLYYILETFDIIYNIMIQNLLKKRRNSETSKKIRPCLRTYLMAF